MHEYGSRGWTRVVLATAVADMNAPTLAEIAAGVDVTADCVPDGLILSGSTDGVVRGTWHNPLIGETAGKYSYSASMQGYRRKQPQPEVLYNEARRNNRRFLIVRRGVSYVSAFAAGQGVAVYDVRFGKRFTLPAGDSGVTFVVSLFVRLDVDDAEVAA